MMKRNVVAGALALLVVSSTAAQQADTRTALQAQIDRIFKDHA